MHILLTGSTGLIGSHVREALLDAGHSLRCVGRRAPLPEHARSSWEPLDFATATQAAQWRPLLEGIDVVVNAVGIFRESAGASFERLHHEVPCALFRAAEAAGVRRVLQISALGAQAAGTRYQASKAAADRCLLGLRLEGIVVQPSLVFAPQGRSSRFFLMLAAMPVHLLPDGGRALIAPVHLDDAVEALCRLATQREPVAQERRIALVGARSLSLAAYLQGLRAGLGLGPARQATLPAPLAAAAARVGERLPGALFDRAALTMLRQGNHAPPDDIAGLLERAPLEPRQFVRATDAEGWRTQAQLAWWLPLLRGSIAAVWLGTAAVSAGLYPRLESYRLLERTGVPEAWQPFALWSAVALDLLLGLLTLGPRRWRRGLWAAQALLILVYTAIITLRLPEFWLHPYGPLLKNLPMLALLGLLATLEPPAARAAGRAEELA